MIKLLTDVVTGKSKLAERRSSGWSTVRKAFLKENPCCAMCGGTKKLEVHHIVPFNVDPSKELEHSNLLTLCEAKKFGVSCHLFFGHLGNFRRSNDEVRKDCELWNNRLHPKD